MQGGLGIHAMRCNTRGQSGRTTMPLAKACLEAGPERASKTATLDKSRSAQNVYHMPDGVATGEELAAWFELQRDIRSAWQQAHGMRKVYESSPPASTFVLYPAVEATRDMDAAQKKALCLDLLAAWTEWAGHPPDAWMIHEDEGGWHIHIFDRMLDVDGSYNATKTMSPGQIHRLHRIIVEEMNRRGHDVEAHVEGGDPMKPPAGLSANQRRQCLEWQERVEANVREREERADKREAELDERKSELDARETALDERKLRLDFRETALDERAGFLDDRERELDAREKQLDARDEHPKTVTVEVERDTPETTRRLEELERRVADQATTITSLTSDVDAKDDEVKRLSQFPTAFAGAYEAAKLELAKVGLELTAKRDVDVFVSQLVAMAKDGAERARTAEGKLAAIAKARATRAKSRDLSVVPGYAADVDEEAPTIR